MNSRNTIQRDMVFDAVACLDHPTADEVYRTVIGQQPTVSRATVYRNLGLLVERGKLRRVSVPSGADHYDTTLAEHYHVSCRLCGRVADVEYPYMGELLAQIPVPPGFHIEEHDLFLRGVCRDCMQHSHI